MPRKPWKQDGKTYCYLTESARVNGKPRIVSQEYLGSFATFIDSANGRAPIAQRGHAKQKRNDLRLVGLGLVVTADGGIPLVSHVYAGNRNDVSQFTDVEAEVVTRWDGFGAEKDQLTLVYDAGQDSEANQ